jgi:hypothetical protein
VDVGTIIWCAFGVLLAYALLAKLAEAVWFVLEGAWLILVRPNRAADLPVSPPDRLTDDVDDAPWVDAYSESFVDTDQVNGEPVWVPPVPPAEAACHVCGGPLLYVVYGFPGGDLIRLAEQGRVILGGCMPGGPRFRCLQGHPITSSAGDVQERRPGRNSPLPPTSASSRHAARQG